MRVFFSYSHRDEAVLNRLRTHMAPLRREGRIEAWYARDILAGDEIDAEIERELEACDLFLLLVTPDFLASEYCIDRETHRALQRHRAGEARVVPIIVEPCDWETSPLRRLRALPDNGMPISDWDNPNHAYVDIVREIRRILDTDEPAAAAQPVEPTGARTRPATVRQIRVPRDFDAIDRTKFADNAFATIREHFEGATAEINTIDDLRGRLVAYSPTSFGCTVVNRARARGTAQITVHRRQDNLGFGDIFYSFAENAPPNTANGGFFVEADEYELYLRPLWMDFTNENEELTPRDAAARLWDKFLEQAGLTYA